jgi:hypothetical protein
MILSIPYQHFEIENISLAPFKIDKNGKPIAKLSYKDQLLSFNDVSIISPAITVIDYNPDNSRLRLDLSNHFNFQIKLSTLYEYLISTFYIHQSTFLNQQNISHEAIRHLFYFIMDGSILSLYIYPTALVKKHKNSNMRVCDLKPGNTIRCVITFQGISQIMNKYDLRLRLHHSVPSIYSLE